MFAVVLGGWQQHDDASAEFAADVITALRRADLTNLTASIYMWGDAKHETELSHALAGRRTLNAYRLTRLPFDFWVQFVGLRAQRLGREVVDHGVYQVMSDVRAYLGRDKGAQ